MCQLHMSIPLKKKTLLKWKLKLKKFAFSYQSFYSCTVHIVQCYSNEWQNSKLNSFFIDSIFTCQATMTAVSVTEVFMQNSISMQKKKRITDWTEPKVQTNGVNAERDKHNDNDEKTIHFWSIIPHKSSVFEVNDKRVTGV